MAVCNQPLSAAVTICSTPLDHFHFHPMCPHQPGKGGSHFTFEKMYPFIQIAVKVFFSTDLKLIIALPHTIANIDTATVLKVFAVWIIFCLLEPNLPSLVQFVSRQLGLNQVDQRWMKAAQLYIECLTACSTQFLQLFWNIFEQSLLSIGWNPTDHRWLRWPQTKRPI